MYENKISRIEDKISSKSLDNEFAGKRARVLEILFSFSDLKVAEKKLLSSSQHYRNS